MRTLIFTTLLAFTSNAQTKFFFRPNLAMKLSYSHFDDGLHRESLENLKESPFIYRSSHWKLPLKYPLPGMGLGINISNKFYIEAGIGADQTFSGGKVYFTEYRGNNVFADRTIDLERVDLGMRTYLQFSVPVTSKSKRNQLCIAAGIGLNIRQSGAGEGKIASRMMSFTADTDTLSTLNIVSAQYNDVRSSVGGQIGLTDIIRNKEGLELFELSVFYSWGSQSLYLTHNTIQTVSPEGERIYYTGETTKSSGVFLQISKKLYPKKKGA